MDSLPPEGKRCSRCQTWKVFSDFYRDARKASGYQPACKVCVSTARKEKREANYEVFIARERAYVARNREALNARAAQLRREGRYRERERRYYALTKKQQSLRIKARRAANPERFAEYERTNRERNRDAINARKRLAYAANPEAGRLSSKEFRRRNPEIVRQQARVRRARLAKAEGSHTAEDVRRLIAQQNGCCHWCGKPLEGTYNVDHRIPLSKGGSDAPANLVITHPTCNLQKRDKMPWEYLPGRLL